jgi:fibronectin-binding autotransporter adhesin
MGSLKSFLAALVVCALAGGPALAQVPCAGGVISGCTSPTYKNLTVLTLTAESLTSIAASTSGGAGLNIAPGVAPGSPNNGDIWTTTAGLFSEVAGAPVGPYGVGTMTGITFTAGQLTGGTINVSGTVGLATTAVTPGAYLAANLTVDSFGRVTAAANGVTGVGAGSCTSCNLTYNAEGQITVAANGSGGGSGLPISGGTMTGNLLTIGGVGGLYSNNTGSPFANVGTSQLGQGALEWIDPSWLPPNASGGRWSSYATIFLDSVGLTSRGSVSDVWNSALFGLYVQGSASAAGTMNGGHYVGIASYAYIPAGLGNGANGAFSGGLPTNSIYQEIAAGTFVAIPSSAGMYAAASEFYVCDNAGCGGGTGVESRLTGVGSFVYKDCACTDYGSSAFIADSLGTTSGPQAIFTGTISGTALSASGVSGAIAAGQEIRNSSGAIIATVVSGAGSSWTITPSQSASGSMTSDFEQFAPNSGVRMIGTFLVGDDMSGVNDPFGFVAMELPHQISLAIDPTDFYIYVNNAQIATFNTATVELTVPLSFSAAPTGGALYGAACFVSGGSPVVYTLTTIASGNCYAGAGGGTVTAITGGTGLTGGTITGAGTLAIATTGVGAGSCTSCNLTYNAEGQITVAANGSGGGSGLTSFDGRTTAAAVLTSGDVTGVGGVLTTGTTFSGAVAISMGGSGTGFTVSNAMAITGFSSMAGASFSADAVFNGTGTGLRVSTITELDAAVNLSTSGGSGPLINGSNGTDLDLYIGTSKVADINTSSATFSVVPNTASGIGYYVEGTPGATCGPGLPTSSHQTIGGITTAC